MSIPVDDPHPRQTAFDQLTEKVNDPNNTIIDNVLSAALKVHGEEWRYQDFGEWFDAYDSICRSSLIRFNDFSQVVESRYDCHWLGRLDRIEPIDSMLEKLARECVSEIRKPIRNLFCAITSPEDLRAFSASVTRKEQSGFYELKRKCSVFDAQALELTREAAEVEKRRCGRSVNARLDDCPVHKPDHGNALFKIAHPNVYARNPFNILNLPINATAKDIRRRREEYEVAFETGKEDVEFGHILPYGTSRMSQTLETIRQAFADLNNPELRLAYSLFWFWPGIDGQDYRSVLTKNREGSFQCFKWQDKTISLPAGPERAIYRHNLAIYYHMDALDYELDALDTRKTGRAYMGDIGVRGSWGHAIGLWNALVDDVDSWHIFADIVSAINDPRCDWRFARSLRDQFAYAFGQINMELAVSFAKSGDTGGAERQIKCMKLSQPETDDVEGTFDDTFAGLQRRVDAIVNAARTELNKNPSSGLAQADNILGRTRGEVRLLRIAFENGAPIRTSIIAPVFVCARRCIMTYGLATKDWNGCLGRILALKDLAETPEQAAMISADERIIREGKEAKEEAEPCWFCKQHFTKSNPRIIQTLSLRRDAKNANDLNIIGSCGRLTIKVPICQSCAKKGVNPCLYPLAAKRIEQGWMIDGKPSNAATKESADAIATKQKLPKLPIPQSAVQTAQKLSNSAPQPIRSGCLIPIVIGAGLLLHTLLKYEFLVTAPF